MKALDGLVGDGVELAVAQVEALGFFAIERAGATTAEDGQLVAGFVHGAIAINAFGDGESRAFACARWRSAWVWGVG